MSNFRGVPARALFLAEPLKRECPVCPCYSLPSPLAGSRSALIVQLPLLQEILRCAQFPSTPIAPPTPSVLSPSLASSPLHLMRLQPASPFHFPSARALSLSLCLVPFITGEPLAGVGSEQVRSVESARIFLTFWMSL